MVESVPPTSAPSGEPLPELSEEEMARQLEAHYQSSSRYIDGSPEHKAALDLLEERGIKKFTYRQHLFKVLYHLTDPSPKEQKIKPPAPVPSHPAPPPAPPPQKLIPLPIIDPPDDIGGEGGV